MTEDAGAPSISRALLWVGLASFWIVQLALTLGAGVALADSILLALILVALPTLTLAQLSAVPGLTIERLPAYWGSIGSLCLLGTVCWFVGTRLEGGAAVGAVGLPAGRILSWGLGLTAAGLATIVAFRQLAAWFGIDETPILRDLLPRTRRERWVFALLSLAAGTGEEIAYRGYAIPLLVPIAGVSGGVAVTSLIFGVLHAYQGVLGVARTAALGIVLAWGFVATGSLWPSVIAHTMIDLIGGLLLADWLVSPQRVRGVGSDPDIRSL